MQIPAAGRDERGRAARAGGQGAVGGEQATMAGAGPCLPAQLYVLTVEGAPPPGPEQQTGNGGGKPELAPPGPGSGCESSSPVRCLFSHPPATWLPSWILPVETSPPAVRLRCVLRTNNGERSL